jgi:hypothetical protein
LREKLNLVELRVTILNSALAVTCGDDSPGLLLDPRVGGALYSVLSALRKNSETDGFADRYVHHTQHRFIIGWGEVAQAEQNR